MSDLETEPKLTSDAILNRGKLALESLRFREEAARIHAARIDLQAALGDAEAGNSGRLQHWLDQYHSLLDNAGGHLVRSTIAENSYDPVALQSTILGSFDKQSIQELKQPSSSIEDIPRHDYRKDVSPLNQPSDSSDSVVSEPKKSPWDSMIQAALAREQASFADNVASTAGVTAGVTKAEPMVDIVSQKKTVKLALPTLTAAETKPLTISHMRPVGNYAYRIDFSDGHSSGLFTMELLRAEGTPVEPAKDGS